MVILVLASLSSTGVGGGEGEKLTKNGIGVYQ